MLWILKMIDSILAVVKCVNFRLVTLMVRKLDEGLSKFYDREVYVDDNVIDNIFSTFHTKNHLLKKMQS